MIISHSKNFFEEGMNVVKLDRWSLELQEFDISLEFTQGKLNKIVDVISRLKNEGLYVEHVDEEQVSNKVSLQDKIEEVSDIATTPSNFERVFNTGRVITAQELLQSQKQDRFCRRLAKNQHKDTNFRINHEELLVKQISILRNTYQVYILPQKSVHRIIKIFHDNRGHQGISRTINMMKRRFWFRKM